jgi:hypothetical protein
MFASSVFNHNIGNWPVGYVTDMSNMFNSSKFDVSIASWNTYNVRDMSNMFWGSVYNQPLTSFQATTYKVTNMIGMFGNCKFNHQLNDLITASVTNMSSMFYGNVVFNNGLTSGAQEGVVSGGGYSYNTLNWNVNTVIGIDFMFYGATSFNSDLGYWRLPLNCSYTYFNRAARPQDKYSNRNGGNRRPIIGLNWYDTNTIPDLEFSSS